MIGLVLGVIGVGYLCGKANEHKEVKSRCRSLESENSYLKLTMYNHQRVLSDYDVVNSYAKRKGFKGAVSFFYYLADNHDYRFRELAKFLCRVRDVRNDIAHNGGCYDISKSFLDKLSLCVDVCNEYSQLSYGRRLRLN